MYWWNRHGNGAVTLQVVTGYHGLGHKWLTTIIKHNCGWRQQLSMGIRTYTGEAARFGIQGLIEQSLGHCPWMSQLLHIWVEFYILPSICENITFSQFLFPFVASFLFFAVEKIGKTQSCGKFMVKFLESLWLNFWMWFVFLFPIMFLTEWINFNVSSECHSFFKILTSVYSDVYKAYLRQRIGISAYCT